MSNTTVKPIWPASEWDTWPSTRYAALIFDVAVVVIYVAWSAFFILRLNINKSNNVYQSRFKRWGFWTSGLDTISLHDNYVTFSRESCCFCSECQNVVRHVDRSQIVSVGVTRQPLLWVGPLWACLTACILGMWLHFIPCIWWTCDWGHHDGQGVRGGIWFSVWPLMTIVFCCLTKTVAIEITYETDEGVCGINKVLVACGGGNCFKMTSPKVRADVDKLCSLLGVNKSQVI